MPSNGSSGASTASWRRPIPIGSCFLLMMVVRMILLLSAMNMQLKTNVFEFPIKRTGESLILVTMVWIWHRESI